MPVVWKMRSLATCALLALAIEPSLAQSATGTIHADITGFRNDNGQVLCDLFSSADAFPGRPQQAAAHTISTITHGRASCEFRDVSPGRYAIAIVHDENMNGKLDRILGMPSEGVGTSRDARGHFGPPKFEDAAFAFSGGEMNLTIAMTYLL
jgi:uncharacterized protein (DUF2141 family)